MPLPPGAPEAARLHGAARALESLVLKQLVVASRAFTGGEGAGSVVRADLFADALADALVRGGGIGLARQLESSLGAATPGRPPPPPSPAALLPAPAGPSHVPAGASPDPARLALTSPFGPRADPLDGSTARHLGVDLAAPEGAELRAAAGGVVRRAGPRGGYGQAVEIDHGGGLSTLYAHASQVLVAEGQAVAAGEPIARAGHTGRATGPHLHLEVRLGGTPVDPQRALKIYGLRADDLVEAGPDRGEERDEDRGH